jgi:hypothetical protein
MPARRLKGVCRPLQHPPWLGQPSCREHQGSSRWWLAITTSPTVRQVTHHAVGAATASVRGISISSGSGGGGVQQMDDEDVPVWQAPCVQASQQYAHEYSGSRRSKVFSDNVQGACACARALYLLCVAGRGQAAAAMLAATVCECVGARRDRQPWAGRRCEPRSGGARALPLRLSSSCPGPCSRPCHRHLPSPAAACPPPPTHTHTHPLTRTHTRACASQATTGCTARAWRSWTRRSSSGCATSSSSALPTT